MKKAITPAEKIALTVPEVADMLSLSKPTVYNLIHTAGFPAFKVGGRTLISRVALEEWVRKQAEAGYNG